MHPLVLHNHTRMRQLPISLHNTKRFPKSPVERVLASSACFYFILWKSTKKEKEARAPATRLM